MSDSKLSDKLNDTELSDKSSDTEFDDVSNMTDYTKFYQLHHISEEKYKFSCVGFFKKDTNINIELSKFEHGDFYCQISNNIIKFDKSDILNLNLNLKDNLYLFDMITMNVLKKDGTNFKIILSTEIKDPDVEKENKGNLMIWMNYKDKQIPLKTNLTHPGNERLPYYIIAELKNKKIEEILNISHD